MRVATTDMRVLRDHPLGTWRRNRVRLGGGRRRQGGRVRDWTTQRAMPLRTAGAVDFAYRTDIPLTMDRNMSEVMAFET